MIGSVSDRLRTIILAIVGPGWLRWLGPSSPRMTLGGQDPNREMHPLKTRWGWVLLLSIVMVLVLAECGPAASAIAPLP